MNDPEFEVRAAFAAWFHRRLPVLDWSCSSEFSRNAITMLLDDPDERIRAGAAMALLDKED